MIGDLYFKDKKFEDAINEFKLVYFGFGGPQAATEVKEWQAYAIYEAARCSFVQVDTAPAELKPKLIEEAIKQFEYLLQNYADDRLAPEAKKQLETLKKLAAG
jgi:outer membrane protein assembly factor BamD (BamD/ComL family)